MTATTSESLQKLRAPFADNQISYLPKGGAKLAYVGHAALTDRLLSVDPLWTWEPVAYDPRGLPMIDEHGGLWIKLTVCGVTRLGYGDAGAKKGGDAVKERIGDALRNAAMRFGAALDLWHKGELHTPEPIDCIAVMNASQDLPTLKVHFAAAWKMTDKAEQPALKAAYDKRTKELTPTENA